MCDVADWASDLRVVRLIGSEYVKYLGAVLRTQSFCSSEEDQEPPPPAAQRRFRMIACFAGRRRRKRPRPLSQAIPTMLFLRSLVFQIMFFVNMFVLMIVWLPGLPMRRQIDQELGPNLGPHDRSGCSTKSAA